MTAGPWSCNECVRRTLDGVERVVAACSRCLPMGERTAETHPNPLEREPEDETPQRVVDRIVEENRPRATTKRELSPPGPSDRARLDWLDARGGNAIEDILKRWVWNESPSDVRGTIDALMEAEKAPAHALTDWCPERHPISGLVCCSAHDHVGDHSAVRLTGGDCVVDWWARADVQTPGPAACGSVADGEDGQAMECDRPADHYGDHRSGEMEWQS